MIFSYLLDALTCVTMLVIQLSLHAIQPLETMVRQLEIDVVLVAKWFFDNYLELNDDKCHLMIFNDKCSKATVTIRNSTIDESDYGKLIGMTLIRN